MQLKYTWQPERIDTRLTRQFPYSRSFFHHIIWRWGILVNGKPTKKSYKLRNNDQIAIDDLQRYLSSEILDETPEINIPIVLEKSDYLVLNKPKWVLSHPKNIRELNQPSVVWFLHHKYKNLPTIWNFIRAGLLHRLDKDTDWLMIAAKTEKWLAHFKELFQDRSDLNNSTDYWLKTNDYWLHKFYRTTCHLTQEWKKFLDWIKNNLPYYIQELVIPKIPHYLSKIWITKILDFKINKETVKINIEILTWRTHQIRYHLSKHWLPIIGDYLYGLALDKTGNEKNKELQLTAYKLIFSDLNWKITKVEI